MAKKKNQILRFVYIGFTIAIIFIVALIDPDLPKIFTAIQQVNLTWVFVAASSIIAFWLVEGFIIKYLASFLHGKISFRKCMKIELIGQYYCVLTPGASGGQPMQIWYLAREGVSVGTGTYMMCIKYICYAASVCTYVLLGFITLGGFIYQNYTGAFWITLVSFIAYMSSIVGVLLIFFNERWVHNIVKWFERVLFKLKLIKNKEKFTASADKLISEFKDAGQYIKKYKGKVLVTYLLSVLQMFFWFVPGCFLYVATGMHSGNLYQVFIMLSLLFAGVSLVPTPGSAGAAEGGFYMYMAGFFDSGLMFLVMVIYRLITFYSHLIVGGTVVVADELIAMRKNKKRSKQITDTSEE